MAIKAISNGIINADPLTGIIVDDDECCGPECACCDVDELEGKTMYMTADQFEIDLPLTGTVNTAADCAFFCTVAKLAAMGWTAIPSSPVSGGLISWPNVVNAAGQFFPGTGIPSCFRLPSILIQCTKGTPNFADGMYRYHFTSSGDPVGDPTGGTGIADTREMVYRSGGHCDGGASGGSIEHCDFHSIKVLPATSDPADWPILGLAGISCDPFYLEQVVEFRIYRWRTFGTPIDGVCYTTGRARIRVTE